MLAILLWVASGLALLAGLPPLAVAIVVVIVLNAVFAFAQEYRADRSAERLRSLLPMSARVRRDDQLRVVDASQLVRGDLVILRPGDRISADLTLTVSHSLAVDESMVSGESVAVQHAAGDSVGCRHIRRPGRGRGCRRGDWLPHDHRRYCSADPASSPTAESTDRPTQPRGEDHRGHRHRHRTLLGGAGLALGLDATQAFLFGVGVSVALVPEGLLPTVTLSWLAERR